jgi:hypothetical protein
MLYWVWQHYYAVRERSSVARTIWEHDKCSNIGKNDLTQRITYWEAVFGPVIHSILDMWHYEVLWTCNFTRLLWYTCDYRRLLLYMILQRINCQIHFCVCSQICSEGHSWLQSIANSLQAWLTLPMKLTRGSQVYSQACSEGHSQLHSMAPFQPAWPYTPKKAHKTLSSTLPSTV